MITDNDLIAAGFQRTVDGLNRWGLGSFRGHLSKGSGVFYFFDWTFSINEPEVLEFIAQCITTPSPHAMSEQLYRIAPLEWELKEENTFLYVARWKADTPFGYYEVYEQVESADEDDCEPSRTIQWTYLFDEYKDEGHAPCASIEEGKRLAEEDWLGRITGCLQSVVETRGGGFFEMPPMAAEEIDRKVRAYQAELHRPVFVAVSPEEYERLIAAEKTLCDLASLEKLKAAGIGYDPIRKQQAWESAFNILEQVERFLRNGR